MAVIILTEKIKSIISALERIRGFAMNHLDFDEVSFLDRDIDGLAIEGGGIRDWTMIAIMADEALQELGKEGD